MTEEVLAPLAALGSGAGKPSGDPGGEGCRMDAGLFRLGTLGKQAPSEHRPFTMRRELATLRVTAGELLRFPTLVLFCAATLLLVRMFHVAHFPYPPMSAESVAYGASEAPFHLRMLAPMLARLGFGATGWGAFFHWNLLVQWVFVAGALATTYWWLRCWLDADMAGVGLAVTPIILLWSLDMPAADGFPQVFFFAAMFLALTLGRPLAFAVVFSIAVLNRETAVILLPAFVLVFRRTVSASKIVALVAGMLTWFVSWKLWIGPAVSPTDVVNKLALIRWSSNWAALQDWPRTLNPLAKNPFSVLGYTWLLAPFAWSLLQPTLRILCVSFLAYYGLMLVVANISETRVFMEWTPLAAAVCAAAVGRMREGKSAVVACMDSTG